MPKTKPQLLPLTGLRFFLALWVVIFHQTAPDDYLDLWMSRVPNIIFCLLRTGYLAVGVFFILSGFILSYNYSLKESWSSSQLIRFSVARFARIYPAYCVGLLLVAPFIGYSVAQNLSAVRVAKESVIAALNWSLLQSWIPSTALSWNAPGWSLSDEAFFYCCFPFVGVALWRLSRMGSLLTAGSVIWFVSLIAPMVAVSLPLSGLGDVPATSFHLNADPFWTNLLKFNPLLRLPDFCIGIVIGRAYYQLRSQNSLLLGRGYWLYVPGIILEILAIVYCNSLPYPLVHNGLLSPIHSLVILGFALGGGILAQLLSISPLVFLGSASYSMYILHSPVALWMKLISKRLFFANIVGPGITIVYALLVVCLASIVFKAIEEPANRILKKRLMSRREAARLTDTAR